MRRSPRKRAEEPEKLKEKAKRKSSKPSKSSSKPSKSTKSKKTSSRKASYDSLDTVDTLLDSIESDSSVETVKSKKKSPVKQIESPLKKRKVDVDENIVVDLSQEDKLLAKFDLGHIIEKKKPKSSLGVLDNYERVFLKKINPFMCFVKKEDPEDPFLFWEKITKVDPSLKDVKRTGLRLLGIQTSSAFSESQFSNAKQLTSGLRASTGLFTLNSNQFIKLNFHLVEDKFLKELSTIPVRAKALSKVTDDLQAQIGATIMVQEIEERELAGTMDEDDESSIASIRKCCPGCGHYALEEFNTSQFKGTISCDVHNCQKKGEAFARNSNFIGCTRCGEIDICTECYFLM